LTTRVDQVNRVTTTPPSGKKGTTGKGEKNPLGKGGGWKMDFYKIMGYSLVKHGLHRPPIEKGMGSIAPRNSVSRGEREVGRKLGPAGKGGPAKRLKCQPLGVVKLHVFSKETTTDHHRTRQKKTGVGTFPQAVDWGGGEERRETGAPLF